MGAYEDSKALDVLIESLKVYVGIATAGLAGSVAAFLSSDLSTASKIFLIISFVSFGLSGFLCIYKFNRIIHKLPGEKLDIGSKGIRYPNIIALVSLGCGFASLTMCFLTEIVLSFL